MKTELVKFHDTEILAVEVDHQWWIAVKPIAEAIGLNAESAARGIKNDEILGATHTIQYVLDATGREFPMICLPIQHVHGWLFSIQSAKVKPEIRERLLIFKKECYDVLFNHFYGKTQNISTSLEHRYYLGNYLKKLNILLTRLTKRKTEIVREIQQIDNENYAQLGLFK